MSLDELLKGLSQFQQGMTQYGVGQGIEQARQKVNEINQMQMKEMEKRQALTQVSNELMMTLSGTGADPATIRQAAMPFVQPELKNSQDFLALAAQTGDQDVMERGQRLQREETRPQREMQQEAHSQQRWSDIYNGELAEKRAGMSASAAASKVKTLPPGVLKDLNTSRAFAAKAEDLLQTFESDKKYKHYVGLLKDNKAADAAAYFNKNMEGFRNALRRYYLSYRRSVTGAAASVTEDEFIKGSIANLRSNPDALPSLIRGHLKEEGAAYNAILEPLTNNYDTTGYEWKFGAEPARQPKADPGTGAAQRSTPINAPAPAPARGIDILNKYGVKK